MTQSFDQISHPKHYLENMILEELIELFLYVEHVRIGFFPLLAITGSLHAVKEYRKYSERDIYPLQAFLSIVISSFAGATFSAVILGEAPGWILNDAVLLVFLMSFIVIYSSERFFKFCDKPLISFTLMTFDCIGHGLSITSWGVDLAYKSPHVRINQSVAMALVCGILSGAGSQFTLEALNVRKKRWSFQAPQVIQEMMPVIKTSVIGASIYYLGARYMQEEVLTKFIVITTICLYNLSSTLLDIVEGKIKLT